ncbi:Na+/proline symporter [Geomicrobium sediminis]|uniref:Na+/proline symporter n=1 Tax=Geomicrobium sediminis TaxID=1347788 RepID=A0ABS2PGY8_9BACL|nr:Na+/proline symporter [Geomicrobium sediminis]
MFIFVYYLTGGWDNVVSNVETNATISNDFLLMFNMPLAEFLMPFMTIGAAMLVRQDTWQRVWAARNLSTTLKANWIAVILMFVTGLMIIVIGVMARAGLGIETDRPDLIYYDVIFGALPFWLSALMFITLVAIIMSCADSFFIAGSTIMVSDIIKPVFKITDDKKLLYVSRLMVIAMAIFSLCLALLFQDL